MKKAILFFLVFLTTVTFSQQTKVKVIDYEPPLFTDVQGNYVSKPNLPGCLIIPNKNYYNLNSTKTPVLVVHGMMTKANSGPVMANGQQMMNLWMNTFNSQGIRSAYITLPSVSPNVTASIVKSAIDSLIKIFNVPQISIVGCHRGAIDVEFALYKQKAARRVSNVFTIQGPHRGGQFIDLFSSKVFNHLVKWFPNQLAAAQSAGFAMNTAAMNAYYANSSLYKVQKVTQSGTNTYHPKTDNVTKWRTLYGNNLKNSPWYLSTLGNLIYKAECGLFLSCANGINDGVIQNFSTKRVDVTGTGVKKILKNNGDHFTTLEGINSGIDVIPFLPSVSSLYKTNIGAPEIIELNKNTTEEESDFYENELTTMSSSVKFLGNEHGITEFYVEENNHITNLLVFTNNKPLTIEIKNANSGKIISEFETKTFDKDSYEFEEFAPGTIATEIKLNNVEKGKYTINVKEPFFGFAFDENSIINTELNLGFTNSEGFNKEETTMSISYTSLENKSLNLSKMKAIASIRRISDNEGELIKNDNITYDFLFNYDPSKQSLEAKIKNNLPMGNYNLTVEMQGGDETTQFIDRTFNKTFYVNNNNNNINNTVNGFEPKTINIASFYPNPTNNIYNIKFNKQEEHVSFEIYNSTGALVETSLNNENISTYQFNFSDYKAGLYFLKVKTKTDETTINVSISK